MKILRFILIALMISSCASKKIVVKQAITPPNIIGSWKGCDERIVEFVKEEDSIFGICRRLGGLSAFGFQENEIGYKITHLGDGEYQGKVKWRFKDDTTVKWRNVKITIDNDTYTDQGSDKCGSKMTKVK